MAIPERGDVWLADLGWSAKTRPVLILSVPYMENNGLEEMAIRRIYENLNLELGELMKRMSGI